RPRYYAIGVLTLWAIVAAGVALWIAERRPWTWLLLGATTPLRLAIGWALAAGYVWLTVVQRRTLLARPDKLERLMRSLGDATALVPHTPGERKGFAVL